MDANPGSGDPAAGYLVGCINCGFTWQDVAETVASWSAALPNTTQAYPLTVDVTARNN